MGEFFIKKNSVMQVMFLKKKCRLNQELKDD